jgi:hypothetical protein
MTARYSEIIVDVGGHHAELRADFLYMNIAVVHEIDSGPASWRNIRERRVDADSGFFEIFGVPLYADEVIRAVETPNDADGVSSESERAVHHHAWLGSAIPIERQVFEYLTIQYRNMTVDYLDHDLWKIC